MDGEEVFNSREVAASLGLAGAMMRRYATEYEAVAGEEIEVHRRNGRLFTSDQVEILKKARALVNDQGLSVRAAMKIALGQDSGMPLSSSRSLSTGLQEAASYADTLERSEVFASLLTNAVQEGNKELLEEMRKLNKTLEHQGRPVVDTLDNKDSKSNAAHFLEQATEASKPHEHGVFVRFAFWIESLFKRQSS